MPENVRTVAAGVKCFVYRILYRRNQGGKGIFVQKLARLSHLDTKKTAAGAQFKAHPPEIQGIYHFIGWWRILGKGVAYGILRSRVIRRPLRLRAMHIFFEVGEQFKQQVEFKFNQLLGLTVIRANGREVKKSVRLISEPVFDKHELDLEGPEKVRVRIEKRRKQLLGAHYLVYVNDRLQQSYQGI